MRISEPQPTVTKHVFVLQFAVIIVSICFLKKGVLGEVIRSPLVYTCMLLLFVDGN